MSLNKTLDRLFDEIRREAKRNPAFADRLDAVLRGHESRRDVSDETIAEVAQQSSPARGGGPERSEGERAVANTKRRNAPLSQSAARPDSSPASGGASTAPALNPAGLFKREGEDALTEALASLNVGALQALVGEHNLDPSGVTGAMDGAELIAHIVAQAKKRAERDEKMFDY
ncbi:MAG TPA: hypothetical protein PKY87_00585 [Terricaulis sp.]|nr:hypothetical protein [Terricaulis sp.]